MWAIVGSRAIYVDISGIVGPQSVSSTTVYCIPMPAAKDFRPRWPNYCLQSLSDPENPRLARKARSAALMPPTWMLMDHREAQVAKRRAVSRVRVPGNAGNLVNFNCTTNSAHATVVRFPPLSYYDAADGFPLHFSTAKRMHKKSRTVFFSNFSFHLKAPVFNCLHVFCHFLITNINNYSITVIMFFYLFYFYLSILLFMY